MGQLDSGPSWGDEGCWVMKMEVDAQREDMYCFKNCRHNMLKAITQRFHEPGKKARERFDATIDDQESVKLWGEAKALAVKLGHGLRSVPVLADEEVLDRIKGKGKKSLYSKAFLKLEHEWAADRWAVPQPFIKIEKYEFYEKRDRIPRPIQPRSMEYRAWMSKFIKPAEQYMKGLILPGCQYPFMAKGADNPTLAWRFRQMWESISDPIALSLDLSKFDATIHPELKRLENSFFQQISNDRRFRRGLYDQLADEMDYLFKEKKAKKLFKLGKFLHGRCSGDPQTGCGNTLIMALVCRVVFDVKCEIFANGDDTIVILSRKDLAYARENMVRRFAYFGLDLKEESCVDHIYDVEWCQCKFTMTQVGDRWIRKCKRVIDTLFTNVEYTPLKFRSLFSQVCAGELNTNPGIPIIAPVCKWVHDNWNVKRNYAFKYEGSYEKHDLKQKICSEYYPPNDLDRFRFYMDQGIDPASQIAIEQRIIKQLENFSGNPSFAYWGPGGLLHPLV